MPRREARRPLDRERRFLSRWLAAFRMSLVGLSLGIVSRKHRRIVDLLARASGHDDRPPRLLPGVDAAEITSERTSVVLPAPGSRPGNVSLLELLIIARLVRERRPLSLFEIGTFDGRTTQVMALNSPASAIVHTLDLPPQAATIFPLHPAERQFVDKPASGALLSAEARAKVRQLHGDSAAFDFSPYRCDFVFIDGSHMYEYVMNDSMRALGLLGGGAGAIVWHDYGEWEGVTEALNELSHEPAFAGLSQVRGTSLALLIRT